MNIIDLETPLNTEKYIAPKTKDKYPFFITEYGTTFRNTPCYQLRMDSPIACVQYVISGSGVIICNDKIYNVNAGDTFLLPEGSNQIYYSNPDNQFERIWLNFKGELSRCLLKIYGLDKTVVFRNVNTFNIIQEIQEACRALTEPEEYKRVTAREFFKLIQFLAENNKEEQTAVSSIENIRAYIDCHITENITISDIAEKFSFSKEHIIRIFKKIYGITPHKYILQSKIRLAMIMLKTTEISIDEISSRLGFSDSKHFSTQFKKMMNYTPSQYRKK